MKQLLYPVRDDVSSALQSCGKQTLTRCRLAAATHTLDPAPTAGGGAGRTDCLSLPPSVKICLFTDNLTLAG
jgi:hypothetical protein